MIIGKKARALMATAALSLCLALASFAQAAKITYIEGSPQAKTSSGWAAMAIGDALAADAVIRLAGSSLVELKTARGTLTLSQSGTYDLKDLLATSQRLASTGALKALAGKFSGLMGGTSAANQTAVAGVRGADKSEGDSGYVESEAQVPLGEGKSLIAAHDYAGAIAKLAEARDLAGIDELPEILFTLGLAQSLQGDERAAMESLADLKPEGASWAPDYYLLEAELLVDAFAYDKAIALLQGDGSVLTRDSNRATEAWFLLGLAYQGKGDNASAKEQLSKVVAAESGSELGKAAAALISTQL
jgi:tetratricopeptide (TPR) repeat protein